MRPDRSVCLSIERCYRVDATPFAFYTWEQQKLQYLLRNTQLEHGDIGLQSGMLIPEQTYEYIHSLGSAFNSFPSYSENRLYTSKVPGMLWSSTAKALYLPGLERGRCIVNKKLCLMTVHSSLPTVSTEMKDMGSQPFPSCRHSMLADRPQAQQY